MGGWSHPDISLEDLIKLVKGFVDILILASGYQSSGQFAHWDPQNIKKAFQWGLFFENVLKHLDDYQESAEKLDAELSELTSNPHFPQGLTELSSATLSRARKFILEHLIHTVPLSDSHLKAFVEATIEIDLDELQKTENNCLHVYLDKLNLQITMLNPCRGFMEDSPFPCPGNVPPRKAENISNSDFTMSTIQEIMRRELAVSCISAIETGMNSLTKIMCLCSPSELNNSFIPEQQKQATAPVAEEQLLESLTWRTRNLSYLLEKRTIRLVSGASMIFLAPKAQWTQVFERLNIPEKTDGDLHETIELLLLGLISSRWNPLLEHFMSVCNDFHDSLTIHSLYHEVHNLLLGRSQHVQSKEEMKRSKEQGILEFLEVLLDRQLHQLWKLSPILVAMSLPSWSQLFRLYLSELASQFKGESPTIRCCSCTEDSKEHIDCFGAFTSFMFAVRHNVWYQFCLRAALHFCWSHLAGEKLRMKTVNMLGSKKIQNMEVAKENLMQLLDSYFCECQNPGFYLMRQFVWRFKSQLKQALEWQRNTFQYSYDPKSYSQNFDDGFLE